jgi:hypothetical protein
MHPNDTTIPPRSLAEIDRDLDCASNGHVFGLFRPGSSVRHCERFSCGVVDAYDPDEFTDVYGGLYDFDDPDREQLGYYGVGPEADAYVLKVL